MEKICQNVDSEQQLRDDNIAGLSRTYVMLAEPDSAKLSTGSHNEKHDENVTNDDTVMHTKKKEMIALNERETTIQTLEPESNNSLFVVNPNKSGKTGSYLHALCDDNYYDVNDLDLTYGPVAIVLVASAKHVQITADHCRRLLYGLTDEASVIVASFGQRNFIATKIKLLNSCGMLIATPTTLLRLLNDNQSDLFNTERLKRIVIDDLDLISSRALDDFEPALKALLTICKKREATTLAPQVTKNMVTREFVTRVGIREGVDLCSDVLEFGECDQPRCDKRHEITSLDVVTEEEGVPMNGELRIHILQKGSHTRLPKKTNVISDSLQFTLKLIDDGVVIKSARASETLFCTEEFKDFPYQAIDIRLMNMVPYDNEPKHVTYVSVNFALASTIWINNLVVVEKLETIDTYVQIINLKLALVTNQFALQYKGDKKSVRDLANQEGLLELRSPVLGNGYNSNMNKISMNFNKLSFPENNEDNEQRENNVTALEAKREEDWQTFPSDNDKSGHKPEPVDKLLFLEDKQSHFKESWSELPLNELAKIEIGDESENGNWENVFVQLIDQTVTRKFNELLELINTYLYAAAIQENSRKANKTLTYRNLPINSYAVLLCECIEEDDFKQASLFNKRLLDDGAAIADPETKQFLTMDIDFEVKGKNSQHEDVDIVDKLLSFSELFECIANSGEIDILNFVELPNQEKGLARVSKQVVKISEETRSVINTLPETAKRKEREELTLSSQDNCCLPSLNALHKRPQTTWHQTNCIIFLSIYASDVKDYYLKVTSDQLYFAADNHVEEHISILYFMGIIKSRLVSHELRGLNVVVLLVKDVCVNWPRLLKDSTKFNWLICNYNAIDVGEIDRVESTFRLRRTM
uniref:RNA helicase n=1 Tax=Glossina austeni TaxID=7395 RepID=A0A1A9UER8_GLOAU